MISSSKNPQHPKHDAEPTKKQRYMRRANSPTSLMQQEDRELAAAEAPAPEAEAEAEAPAPEAEAESEAEGGIDFFHDVFIMLIHNVND